jgi:MFS family permease
MICGANSDLFGRRWFLIMGNVLMFIGYIMGGVAKNTTTMIAGFAILGNEHKQGSNLTYLANVSQDLVREILSWRPLRSLSSCRTSIDILA